MKKEKIKNQIHNKNKKQIEKRTVIIFSILVYYLLWECLFSPLPPFL